MAIAASHRSFEPPELLTVNQVADLLSVSPRLVWLLSEQNKLLPVRIRRCTRWRRTDIYRYIDQLGSASKAQGGEP